MSYHQEIADVLSMLNQISLIPIIHLVIYRNDEKTAADYRVQGGSVLHLVLALRGGSHC